MIKLLDSIFKTRLDINFVGHKKLRKAIYDVNYQIVEFKHNVCWKKEHLVLSTNFNPTNFSNEFNNKLNKNKKIILYGEWRKLIYYYRILKFNNYKVYIYKN